MAAHYSNSAKSFINDNKDKIVGILNHESEKEGFYSQLNKQIEVWNEFLIFMQSALKKVSENICIDQWGILMEYPIPRRGKRIDCLIILPFLIIVIEYKYGKKKFESNDISQLEDYCLDLRDFHKESKNKYIQPILLVSYGSEIPSQLMRTSNFVQDIVFSNQVNFVNNLIKIDSQWNKEKKEIEYKNWNNSSYKPTPTIIEAAISLYANKQVDSITKSETSIYNLSSTSDTILETVKYARNNKRKVICFITGVPGAGKTLAGLNIIHNKNLINSETQIGSFLSGNVPLINVLTKALARDYAKRNKITVKESERQVKTFIHNVHQFLNFYFDNKTEIPPDKIVVFDEAQRAWDARQSNRKFKRNFSESEMMFEIMNRHDWAVIVSLIGSGQELNSGEAGLREWGRAIETKYRNWEIYISSELNEAGVPYKDQLLDPTFSKDLKIVEKPELHLKVSIRSYRSEALSDWVNKVIAGDVVTAKEILKNKLGDYPIYLTRSLQYAKNWLNSNQKGTRRTGLLASSGGRRLKAFGIDVDADFSEVSWFLNDKNDVRSSFYLEIVAKDFKVQGLELDWAGVCWDIDFFRKDGTWDFRSFRGTKWVNVNQESRRQFIKNKYRVLLTRAREGMVIWVPEGNLKDLTRQPVYYDRIYEYLTSIGIPIIA